MHGNTKIKFVNAKQAKTYYNYMNNKRKMYRINAAIWYNKDRLCGLVVRVSGYRYRGLGFDSRRYQIF